MFSRYLSRAGPFIAVTLAAVGGLIFDAMTPEIISTTLFYVSAVLASYWFPQPKAPLALLLLAVPLIIIGHWIAIPNKAPDWESWLNRGLSIGTVSLAAVFVWYIRVLEQKLQASKDCLQFALDAARLGWWQYDPRRGVASGDTRFKEIFDVISGEVPSEDIKELVHPDDAERYWADRREALDPADPKSSAHQYRVRPRDGKPRWVEVRWLAHFEGAGSRERVASAFATVQDITERKHHEELLQRQADLLDQSHDAILTLQTGGRGIVYWSRGAERLYGYTAAEAEGRRTHELLQTRAPIPIEDIDAQIVHQGRWYGELIHTTRDGRNIVVESRIVRVSYDGETFALETNRDITSRKRAEEELRKSEERFRTSILHSPVPTILFDDREQMLAISQSWLKAAGGLPAAELERIEDWTKSAYGERSGEVLELIREIIAAEPEARTDEQVLTLDGDKRIWNFVTSGLGTLSNGRRLFISVAQDVTDRRAYEDRIELLVREGQHRTKNILGLVQVIARQTAAGNPEDFLRRFTERVQALAANQNLLSQNQQQGADLEDLVRTQLAHFSDFVGSRVTVHGPKVHLNAVASQAIGLALHELATNASKYGALSTDSGRVDVDWRTDAHSFAISWTERGGPPVRPPDRRGFGSTVTEQMAKRAVGGEVEVDYAPSGFGWHLTCPAANALEATGDIHKS